MSDNVYLGGNAAILQSIVDGTPYDAPIQSPIEALLLQVKEVIEAGGGGGGTTNYNQLTNKPQINGETLQGDLSGNALGLLTISNTMPEASSDLEGQQLLYVGATTASYTKGLIYECQEVTPTTSPKTYRWVAISAVSIEIDAALSTTSENPVQNKVVTLALGDKLSMVTTMGAASAELLGARLLYVGATDANFTKGCIYECQEVTPATDPATYTWVVINVNDITVDNALSASSENPVQNKVIYSNIYNQLYTTLAGLQNNAKGAMELYSKDLNTITTSGFYNAMTCTNAPFNYCMLIVCGYYLTGYCSQIAIDATTGAVRFRNQINGTWGAWDDLTQVDGTTITKDATTKEISAAYDTAPTQDSGKLITSGGVYTALADKVDKVSGKGLSTNDYTTTEKNKLAGLSNYDDTALAARVTALETALSNLNALVIGS